MINLTELNLDFVDARTERAHQPELLTDCFVNSNSRVDELGKPHKFIISGPKGSGKTALAAYHEIRSRQSHDDHCKIEYLDEFDFEVFANLSFSSHRKIWTNIVMIRMILLLNEDNLFAYKNSNLNDFVNELSELGLSPSSSMTTIESKTKSKEQALQAKALAAIGKKSITTSAERIQTLANINDTLFELLAKCAGNKGHKYTLYIDDFDYSLVNYDDGVLSLGGLIRALRDINERLTKSPVDGKVVFLIRDELVQEIEDPEASKIVSDHGILLKWDYRSDKVLDTDLFNVIFKRAELIGSVGNLYELWDSWFERRIGRDNSEKYVIERTRGLPRDLIRFVMYCQNEVRHGRRLDARSVLRAEVNYGTWFESELSSALVGLVDPRVRSRISDMMRAMGHPFSEQHLAATLQSYFPSLAIDSASLSKILFDTHWVGNVWNSEEGFRRVDFKHRRTSAKFSPAKLMICHKGYIRSASIQFYKERLSDWPTFG